jgi:hypothetical protein
LFGQLFALSFVLFQVFRIRECDHSL